MTIFKIKTLGLFAGQLRTKTGFIYTKAYTRNCVIENLLRLSGLLVKRK